MTNTLDAMEGYMLSRGLTMNPRDLGFCRINEVLGDEKCRESPSPEPVIDPCTSYH